MKLYQVDAFTKHAYAGNPAAVVPLKEWLADDLMQKIAAENNLAETAFFVPKGDGWHLRWFTPEVEIELCGHATLASGWVITSLLEPGRTKPMRFETMSGTLSVSRQGDLLTLDFPSYPPQPVPAPAGLAAALGAEPAEHHAAGMHLAVFKTQSEVAALKPDFGALKKVDVASLIVTAPGESVDFVSRFFVPKKGINEDPVTGSAHCRLIPYWAKRLGKNELTARQISRRGGDLACRLRGDRVDIAGHCALYLEGEIKL